MDAVFRAINDSSRRLLLDHLFEQDGQTLGELCGHLPEMTRFGVMNHLRVLEEAGLITTRKQGRSKHHYLNPVPIRVIHDRWISKYAEPTVGAVAALKARFDPDQGETPMSAPAHIYQTYIRADRDEVWRALTDGDMTVQYFYGTRVESDWTAAAPVRYTYPDGTVAADGEVISIDPPHKLEITFHARWDPELEAEGPVREVWLVTEADGATLLTVEIHGVAADSKTVSEFSGGFPYILSGLKTLLETGAPMTG